MIARYERLIATRYLRPVKGESFIFIVSIISLMGIALGVAALVAVMSVMNGFRADLLDRILGVNGHALVQGYDGRLDSWQPILADARKLPGVVRAIPIIEQQLMASRPGRASGVTVRGVRPEDVRGDSIFARNIKGGSFDGFRDGEPVIALGSQLASLLLARVGDSVSLISPEGRVTPFGVTPRIASFRVVAIFEVGVYQYDQAFVMMPLASAQRYFQLGDAVGGIEIVTDNPDKVGDRVAPLQTAVNQHGVIVDWRSLNRALFEALEVERVVMFWILTIIIVVAAFNIVSSLIMLVRAKTRDIAILRTMGASRAAMMRVFILAGLVIGALGILVGLALGFTLLHFRQEIVIGVGALFGIDLWNPEVRFLSEMPALVDPLQIAGVCAVAFVMSLLATLYPSWKAANTDPVQVLRYE